MGSAAGSTQPALNTKKNEKAVTSGVMEVTRCEAWEPVLPSMPPQLLGMPRRKEPPSSGSGQVGNSSTFNLPREEVTSWNAHPSDRFVHRAWLGRTRSVQRAPAAKADGLQRSDSPIDARNLGSTVLQSFGAAKGRKSGAACTIPHLSLTGMFGGVKQITAERESTCY